MKFVHIADIHFDSPFIKLSDRGTLGDLKRLEQRKIFKEVIEYVKENEIPYLFISGDIYEQNYVKKSTIEYINHLLKEIPNTRIFIAPGNHDPYVKNSYYQKFNWNENVKIFHSEIEKVETEEADIYGYGFGHFYCTECGMQNFAIENKDKINILVIHGTLDGANLEEKQYNSMSTKLLESKGFDYVALGHIHKSNFQENHTILYPGSLTALGFDELGEHGMIVGEIEKENVSLEFVPLEGSKFIEKEIDVTELHSQEEIIEKINELEIEENEYVKVILMGKRNFEIDTYELYKLIINQRVIKIKNRTKINYDLEKLSKGNTLKALFAREMKEKMENQNLTRRRSRNHRKGD